MAPNLRGRKVATPQVKGHRQMESNDLPNKENADAQLLEDPPWEKSADAENAGVGQQNTVQVIDLTSPSPVKRSILYDEVEVVDLPQTKPAIEFKDVEEIPLPNNFRASNGGEETTLDGGIQVLGTVNRIQFPHMRPHCTKYELQENAVEFCDLCYCYVCDVKVSECTDWAVHCRASDTGRRAQYWGNERTKVKQRIGPATETIQPRIARPRR
jgi:hypothetical protein